MSREETERLLQEIGRLLAEDREYPLDGTLLFAELDSNMVGSSIFKDRENDILYRRRDSHDLDYALLDLWEAQDTDKRWAEMAYVVRNGRFEAAFTYPDQIDPDEDPLDRRDRVVRSYFGDKPIVYPPWPPDGEWPSYELNDR